MIGGNQKKMQKFSELLTQLSGGVLDLVKQIKLFRKEVKLRVTKQYPGGEEDHEKTLTVKTFVAPPATVSVSYGRTINLGDFEFARIDMKLTLPCYTEEITPAFAYAENVVKELLAAEVGAITNGKESVNNS